MAPLPKLIFVTICIINVVSSRYTKCNQGLCHIPSNDVNEKLNNIYKASDSGLRLFTLFNNGTVYNGTHYSNSTHVWWFRVVLEVLEISSNLRAATAYQRSSPRTSELQTVLQTSKTKEINSTAEHTQTSIMEDFLAVQRRALSREFPESLNTSTTSVPASTVDGH